MWNLSDFLAIQKDSYLVKLYSNNIFREINFLGDVFSSTVWKSTTRLSSNFSLKIAIAFYSTFPRCARTCLVNVLISRNFCQKRGKHTVRLITVLFPENKKCWNVNVFHEFEVFWMIMIAWLKIYHFWPQKFFEMFAIELLSRYKFHFFLQNPIFY